MKYVHVVVVIVILIVSGCNVDQNSETINVGLLLPLTGGAASYGQNARQSAELALQEYNASDPSISINLVVEDSKGEAATGNLAVQKLIDLDGVVAVLGCVTSGVTLAVAPTMNTQMVPIISPGASSPNITTAGEYIFRTWPSDMYEAEEMARYIADQQISNVAILRINNEYGMAMENALKESLESSQVSSTISISESFEQGAREMRSQLLRIKESDAEVIYFIGFPEAAIVFGQGFSDVGIALPVLSTSAFEDPQIPATIGDVLNGTIYTKPISNSPNTAAFSSSYSEAFGEDPGLVSDTAYDAMKIILDAIISLHEAGQPITGENIQKFVLEVENYVGVSGILSFDENGDLVKPIGLFMLQDGQYQSLELQPAS